MTSVVRYRIEGPQSLIQEARRLIESDDHGLRVVEAGDAQDQLDERRPFGMEPWSYILVAFTAHLAASLAHDAIEHIGKSVLSRIRNGKTLKVTEVPVEDRHHLDAGAPSAADPQADPDATESSSRETDVDAEPTPQ